jgi:hypothetical protein
MPIDQWMPWLLAVLALMWGVYLKGHNNRVRVTDRHAEEIEAMKREIVELKLAQARTESPLMKQVQDLLSTGLHHPDPAHSRQDALLEKLDRIELTAEERPELIKLLTRQIANPHTPPNEVMAAKALVALMPLVVKEQAAVEFVTNAAEKKAADQ